MIGNVSYTRMLNDAEDSPLVKKVGDENQYTAIVALTYNF
jgi:outer membrane scaffolding protein for murein synthesis (MipA/OmpV family)